MATAFKLGISVTDRGFVNTENELSPEAALKTNALLMQNHELHHVYFDEAGLHSKQQISLVLET